MKINPLQYSDVPELIHISEQHAFPLPSRLNKISEGIVRSNFGEFLGYGITKAFAESVLIINKELSHQQRGRVLIMLLNAAIKEAKEKGIEQLHVFIKDSPQGYEDILKKHFHFQDCSGTPLVLNLE